MATPDELFLFELNNIFIETKKPMAKNGFLDPYINITTEPIIAAISASLFLSRNMHLTAKVQTRVAHLT